MQQLFISLPSCPVAKQSLAVSIHHIGTLCLSGNLIHFRRQALCRMCVRVGVLGEMAAGGLIGLDGWWATGMLTGRQPWYIHERRETPQRSHTDVLSIIIP